MSLVLVTGASGLVGRHAVAELIEQGFVVHAVARRPLLELPAIWHQIDLFDAGARRRLIDSVRPTHLLHLAWEARHGYFWEAPENLDWVSATLDLVRSFSAAGGVRAVFAGSCAEYDWSPAALRDGACRETETPCRPSTLYGLAKVATHDLVAAFAARNGLSYAWGRVFFLYGAFETATRLVPSVIQSLLQGQSMALGDGGLVRDFLDTRDAGAAFAALLTSKVSGPVNIASGTGVTLAEVGRHLVRLVDAREQLLAFGARPASTGEPPRLIADVVRLRDEAAFTPRYDLAAGLADAVAWWRSQTVGARELEPADE